MCYFNAAAPMASERGWRQPALEEMEKEMWEICALLLTREEIIKELSLDKICSVG